MDPVTIALLGGGALGQIFGGAAARSEAQRALAQQMRMFDEQMRLAKADRTDAYGNVVRYDDATDSWLTDLTPRQKALIRAGEYEQFQGLTTDAARNRAARGRQAAIGESSAEDYNRELAEYRYAPRKSEDQIYSELASLVARSRGRGNRALTNQRLRQGRPLVTIGGVSNGPDPAEDALRLRKAALEEFSARNSQRNQQLQPLNFFRSGVGGGGGAQFQFSETPQQTNKTADAMAQLIASVGKSGADNILSAQQGVTKATQSMFPNMTDSARMIAALRGQGRGGLPKSGTGRTSTSFAQSPDFSYASPDFPYEFELGM